jgi:hypothetical protein
MRTKVAKRDSQAQTLTRAGDNLYRSDASEIYYASFERNGKQIRLSLRTTDKDLARRSVETMRHQMGAGCCERAHTTS